MITYVFEVVGLMVLDAGLIALCIYALWFATKTTRRLK